MQRLLVSLLFLLALVVPFQADATAQDPDSIRIDGKVLDLDTNPLTAVIVAKAWRPPKEAAIWSSNWRGYIAEWEIRDGRLLLIDATIRVGSGEREQKKSILIDLFEVMAPIDARWFSGVLIVPDGEMTRYVHMGYGSTYAHYQVLRIEAGQVVQHLSLKQSEFEAYRDKKFEEFRQTQEYRTAYEEAKKHGSDLSEEMTIRILKSLLAERYLSR